jgi:hypothetical protein
MLCMDQSPKEGEDMATFSTYVHNPPQITIHHMDAIHIDIYQ